MESNPSQSAPPGGTNRGLYLGFLLVLAVFAASAVASALNGRAVLRDNEAVVHSEHVLRAQTQVTADFAGVEAAARGFVASKRAEFLVEYQSQQRVLEGSLRNLSIQTVPGRTEENEIQELSALINDRIVQLDGGIERAKRGDPVRKDNDPAVRAARAARQKLARLFDALRLSQTVVMNDRRVQSQQSVEWAFICLWLSAIIGALALTGFFLAARRNVESARSLRALEKSRAEELEERVRERTWELSQANRDLEAFSYSVSHDLRAPLRAMNGFASILRKDLAGRVGAEEVNMLERIQRNCTKMSELTESLLALFRVGKADLSVEDVNLSAMAGDVVNDLRLEYAGREYAIQIQPGLKAMGDRQMLNALLVNLLGNAMKFSSKVASPRIEFWSEGGEDGMVFAIRDNGAGFDPSQSGLLFEPFHRLHAEREFSGNGVGLAMCRKIVARHRGTIWLDSAINQGATVRFRLGLGKEVREPVSLSSFGNASRGETG